MDTGGFYMIVFKIFGAAMILICLYVVIKSWLLVQRNKKELKRFEEFIKQKKIESDDVNKRLFEKFRWISEDSI
jgi:hypothetical protein